MITKKSTSPRLSRIAPTLPSSSDGGEYTRAKCLNEKSFVLNAMTTPDALPAAGPYPHSKTWNSPTSYCVTGSCVRLWLPWMHTYCSIVSLIKCVAIFVFNVVTKHCTIQRSISEDWPFVSRPVSTASCHEKAPNYALVWFRITPPDCFIEHSGLHYITLHYTTLHYTTLHYITLHTYIHIYNK